MCPISHGFVTWCERALSICAVHFSFVLPTFVLILQHYHVLVGGLPPVSAAHLLLDLCAHLQEPGRAIHHDKEQHRHQEHPRLQIVSLFEEGRAHGDVALDGQSHGGIAGAGQRDLSQRDEIRQRVDDHPIWKNKMALLSFNF